MRQLTIFDAEESRVIEEKKKTIKTQPIVNFKPCAKCGIYPIIKNTTVERSGYTFMKCPICGYSCGTSYSDAEEHWNSCQDHRIRTGFRYEQIKTGS